MEFSNIGKKIQQTGQGAVDKTKKATEKSRLNSTISNLEKEITGTYSDIGKTYFQKYQGNPPDPEMNPYFQKVESLMEQIGDCRVQINQLSGVAYCIACGKEINAGAKFCNFCGASQTPENAEKNVSNTQNVNKRTQEDMVNDDAPVQKGSGEEDSSNFANSDNADAASPRICPNCGEQLAEGEIFCLNCGERVG